MCLNTFIVLKSIIKWSEQNISGNLKPPKMKMKLLIALVSFSICNLLSGQIKIGDNPQNIDASSVLELESNSRVLVITRVSGAQMNSITPLPGALVYNTDEGCVFYFNGTTWLNLCEEGIFNTNFNWNVFSYTIFE